MICSSKPTGTNLSRKRVKSSRPYLRADGDVPANPWYSTVGYWTTSRQPPAPGPVAPIVNRLYRRLAAGLAVECASQASLPHQCYQLIYVSFAGGQPGRYGGSSRLKSAFLCASVSLWLNPRLMSRLSRISRLTNSPSSLCSLRSFAAIHPGLFAYFPALVPTLRLRVFAPWR